jgi:hypothetical protein
MAGVLSVLPNDILGSMLACVDLGELQVCRKINKFLKSFIKPSKHYRPTWIELSDLEITYAFISLRHIPFFKPIFRKVNNVIFKPRLTILPEQRITCANVTTTATSLDKALGLFDGINTLTISINASNIPIPNSIAAALVVVAKKNLSITSLIINIDKSYLWIGDTMKTQPLRDIEVLINPSFKQTTIKKLYLLCVLPRKHPDQVTNLFYYFPALEEVEFANNEKLYREGNDWSGEYEGVELVKSKRRKFSDNNN